jgi:hypothetical protein
MNDKTLEHRLQALRPTEPSADLWQRVDQDMALAEMFRTTEPAAAPSLRTTWPAAVLWSSLGAAAAIAVLSLTPLASFLPQPQAKLAATAIGIGTILPINTSREYLEVEDDGIVLTNPQDPQRQVRLHSLERRSWIDPSTGAEYTIEEPQVESMILPASYQ